MAKAPRTSTNTTATLAAAVVAGLGNTPVGNVQFDTSTSAAVESPVGYVEPTTPANVQVNPPILDDAAILARSKQDQADKAAAGKQAKADKKAADEKEKAERKAATDAAKQKKQDEAAAEKKAKAEAKAAAKVERDARMAELSAGRTPGSMLALADKVKQGAYVKSATGQLHSGDELATALDGISATDVIRIGLDVLKLEDNPYAALNIGQQSMNLRNRMRGAIKKEVLTIATITEYVARNKIVQVTAAEIEAQKAERKAKAEANKAERAAKAAAKPATTKVDEPVVLDGEQDRRGLELND